VDTHTLILIAVPLVFMASLVQTTIGFGASLIAIPVLTLCVGAERGTPLMAPVSVIISTIVMANEGRHVRFKDTLHFLISTIIGLPVGLWLLKSPHQDLLQILLGVTVAGFALYKLLHPHLIQLKSDRLLYPFGILAGILGGAFTINGPPLVIYGNLRGWTPRQFRATLQGYFLITAFIISAGHGLSGLWSRELALVFACCLPGMIIAAFLGVRLSRKLPAGKFDKLVFCFLLLTGVVLIAKPFLN
jgi:uncharacterized membrane protein YfcA